MNAIAFQNDWYASEIARVERQPIRLGGDRGVARGWGYTAAADKQRRLSTVLSVVGNFARLAGVPRDTDIRLARRTEQGTAAAGFYDLPGSFERPYILIDEAVIFRTEDPDEQIDVAIGLALHEASHILWSRQIFRRLADDSRDPRLRGLENLLEDWRIEERMTAEAPGWAPYLFQTRRVLLADQWLQEARLHWDQMVDLDKIGFLIGCFIRTPHLLQSNPAWREWTDLMGRNIFSELRTRLPRPPLDEESVRLQAIRLLDLVADYWNRAFDELKNRPNVSADQLQRLRDQLDADCENRRRAEAAEKLRRFSLEEFLQQVGSDAEVIGGSSGRLVREVSRAADGEVGTSSTAAPAERRRPRALPEQRLPANLRGQVMLKRCDVTPAGRTRYEQARQRIAHQVARLRHAFAETADEVSRWSVTSSGKLDSRRLWRSPFDETIFCRKRQDAGATNGLIALLLDASGSMFEGQRFERALETAVLLNESLGESPHRVEIFSHTADNERCVVYHHGAAGRQSAASIGCYRPYDGNFDDQAITAVTSVLHAPAAQADARYLISVSDGLPCAPDGWEGSGVDATREAVSRARAGGWKVISIGIGDEFCNEIYGQRWSLRCDDVRALPENFANLLMRILR